MPSQISEEKILSKLRLIHASLRQDFMVDRPMIAVLSLNPHSGDGGLLGTEEQDIIIPAIRKAEEEGILAYGPSLSRRILRTRALREVRRHPCHVPRPGPGSVQGPSFEDGVNLRPDCP